MKPLHVVQLPRRFARRAWGGTETLVLESSRCLQSLGHDVRIFTTQALEGQQRELFDGVDVQRFAHFYPYLGLSRDRRDQLELKGGNPFSVALLRALLSHRQLDLIHLHTGKRLGGIARWVARRRRIPYVVTLNGGAYDIPEAEREALRSPSRGAFEWGRALGWWFGSRRVMEDAAAIICVGQREHELARRLHPNQRVVYVPNGVDAPRFARGDGTAFRRAHAIPTDARMLLCVGRIDPQKNQEQLVRLLPRWRASIPNIRLVLVGAPTNVEYLGRIRTLARTLAVEDALTLIPGLEPDSSQLAGAYGAADGFVLPSHHEPFGIVVLEAWAAGLPVVAARVGGLPGFMRHDEDGLLATPGDDDDLAESVRRILVDEQLARRLASAGERRSREEFSWNACTSTLVDLYREVIHENPLRH